MSVNLTLCSTLGAFMCLAAVVTNTVTAFRTEAWVLYVMGILGSLVNSSLTTVLFGYHIIICHY